MFEIMARKLILDANPDCKYRCTICRGVVFYLVIHLYAQIESTDTAKREYFCESCFVSSHGNSK